MTSLAIHGGAGALPRTDMTPARAAEFHAALHAALLVGRRGLEAGGSSMDAVEATVTWLEDCPLFNAGCGSSFTRDGRVEMEASIMDGATRKVGAATLLRAVRNPVQLARRVLLHTPHVALGGAAAEEFAVAQGLRLEPPEYFFTQFRWDAMVRLRGTERTSLSEDLVAAVPPDSPEAAGTVGAVALDRAGNLAAATSSGGTTNKYSGRIGQACLPGAGVYAHNATCAVSCTGQGEAFMRSAAAYDVAALMEYGGLDLEAAAERVIRQRLPGKGGLIAIDARGRVALPFNTEGMYRGWVGSDGRIRTAIYETVKDWA
ncbi:MAG TPA: isoaspartyl peptidase/L-asparaginase [Opitutaceae bacterium]|nr:isoaspartyl peptidase/L-asparaginase [Opitutaceae bacterium]